MNLSSRSTWLTRNNSLWFGAVGGIGVLVFLSCLNWRDITTSHEARVAQTARRMAAAGWPWAAAPAEVPPTKFRSAAAPGATSSPDWDAAPLRVNPWIAPVFGGQIRLQKPPLPYWCAAVVDRLAGTTAAAGRWTPALFGLLSAWLIASAAQRLLGAGAGGIAAILWATSQFVVAEYRKSMADPFLAFFTLLAFWGWVRAATAERGERAGPVWLLLAYAAMGLGALAKGPLIFLHAGAAIGAYHAGYRPKRPGRWPLHLLGAALFFAIALPWPIYVLNTIPGARQLWLHELFGGVGGEVDNPRPWYMYLGSLFLITLPWTPLWLAGIVQAVTGADRRGRFLLLWMAFVVLAMSISSQKKDAYLLPLMPAQVLLATLALLNLSKSPSVGSPWQIAQWVVGLLMVGAYAWSGRREALPAGLILAGAAGAVLLASTFFMGAPRAWLGIQAAGYAIWIFAFLNFIETPHENSRSARPFAAVAGPMLSSSANVLLPNIPAEAAFYLPLDLKYRPRETELLAITEGSPRNETSASLAAFFNANGRLPSGIATHVERVPLPPVASPQPDRWRVVRLTIAPEPLAPYP